MGGKESQCPIVVLKRGNGPPGPRGAKGVPRCGRGVGTTLRTPCLTSVSPRNHPVVWGTAIPQRDEPGAFNVHARICGSPREQSLGRPGPEQWTKIREAHSPFAEKYRTQRAEQHELVQAELKTISELLTPEQREKFRSFIEARMVHAPVAQSIAERLRAVADHLGLSTEQRTKIRETHRGFVEKYNSLNDERQALLQDEHKALCATLTPEQREKVQSFFEDRVVVVGGDLSRLDENQIAQLRETIAERLNAVADKLGITAEQ